ncbi:MAG TPA: MdtA/MuxA family multidrug efflux RND transporter periplasmic adaptor subunit, partial [Vicinamibacteria bacterium]|nr:MdtA/MuxA family multidrug efflux RND transporter periplasmic adaptor subunit [Vicinamibacteria bacterium]
MTLETPVVPARAGSEHNQDRAETRSWWRRHRLLVLGGLVLVVALFLFLRGGKKGAAPAGRERGAGRVVAVVAVPAKLGDMSIYLDGLGTVTAINTVTVRSRVDGQLINVSYREGQLVHSGDLLAQIDPRPFEVQLEQVQGQYAKDEANLKNARLDLKRYQVLMAEDSIPRQQLDTQASTVNQLEGTLKADQAQVDNARINLAYTRITAPIGGRVGLRVVDPGNMIHATDPNGLVVITQLQPIAVVFTIPADQLPPVMAGMAKGTRLHVEAWDRDRKNVLGQGTLDAVDNQIDETTGTVRLKAVFPNEGATLFSNQFVNARLLVDTLHSAVMIPTASLQRSPQTTYVWVVKPDSTVEMRDVTVEHTEGEQSAVTGVTAPEPVVTDGVDNL